jgi:xylulose-5-phosphate/fructose-6-phosphate phosphoketolase
MSKALSKSKVQAIDAYWRAANYLSVGQIYLLDNPLLKEPLKPEQVKPRLLGQWGTTPGLNFIYVHLNRVIKQYDLNMIYITGPGHGGPGIVANIYLEGTYSEVYPNVSRDEAGMKRLFKQFSFPGGIPSHVAPETPGSIHEGGELGYALSHAYDAAFDNPDLLVADVIDRVPKLGYHAAYVKQAVRDKLIEHKEYITTHGDDLPEIRDWRWTD